MTTRRTFLQLAATSLAPAWLDDATSAEPDSRIALVIGNRAYPWAPLANPVNDAMAIADLFGQAGLLVETLTDLNRIDMRNAIERFGDRAQRGVTRQVFFYYAGHGAQLDWRNYLLGVDSEVTATEQIPARCVDLSILLGRLSALKDKTIVVILDACRNDPFGSSYRPQQRGLSQFDAPAGSLLAYSTAPGSVSSDGEGRHGLYTEHLLRELSVRTAKIEDALKRVRLGVRIASRGLQVPWETTSLEGDLFLFGAPAKKTDADLEREIEEDIGAWEAIKASRSKDDWIAYLRRFPNGRFAEIAQMRLAKMLAGAAVTAPLITRPQLAADDSLPKVASNQDYEALPVGALYEDPKGNVRRKAR